MSPMRVQLEPSLRQASMVVPFARRSSVSPTASSCRIVSRVTMVPLSMRSSRTWSVPVCWMVRSSYPSAAGSRAVGCARTDAPSSPCREAWRCAPTTRSRDRTEPRSPSRARRRPRAGEPIARDVEACLGRADDAVRPANAIRKRVLVKPIEVVDDRKGHSRWDEVGGGCSSLVRKRSFSVRVLGRHLVVVGAAVRQPRVDEARDVSYALQEGLASGRGAAVIL